MNEEQQDYAIHYEFELRDGSRADFEVVLDARTLLDRTPTPAPETAPEWTRLEREKCPACPLRAEASPLCPVAARLVPLVERFSETLSYDRAVVRVRLPEREVSKETTVKEGIGSLLGLKMTTSGCPVLAGLRPMVRFHLPFATMTETIFRSVATYLVGQHLRAIHGQTADWELRGLVATYAEVEAVNRAFARRLRSAVVNDANMNALIQLDNFAKALPDSIDDRLEELAYLYEK